MFKGQILLLFDHLVYSNGAGAGAGAGTSKGFI
jgi:hypothetical protein